jgi:hypothetical protein
MIIDGVPHLQAILPDGPAADRFVGEARKQAEAVDANDIFYSLKSSADYDPEPGLATIRTKVFALNFGDDEFNPEALHVLERLMPRVPLGRFIVQPGSETSFGHLTMAHPDLWRSTSATSCAGSATLRCRPIRQGDQRYGAEVFKSFSSGQFVEAAAREPRPSHTKGGQPCRSRKSMFSKAATARSGSPKCVALSRGP